MSPAAVRRYFLTYIPTTKFCILCEYYTQLINKGGKIVMTKVSPSIETV